MKTFLARMNAKGIVSSLVLAFAMTACSSKQGAVDASLDGEASSELQAKEDMLLGDEGGSDMLAEDSPVAADTAASADGDMLGSGDDLMGDDEDPGTPSAEVVSSSAPSIPQQSNESWSGGSLKSEYTPGMTHWTVAKGETLALIAEAVFGSSKDYKKLMALNPELANPNMLKVGQKLRLQAGDAVAQVDEVEEQAAKASVAEANQSSSAANDTAAGTTTAVAEEIPTVAVTDAAAATPVAEVPAAEVPVESNNAVDAAAAGTVADGALNNMVNRVDLSSNKLKFRNILLGIAVFFMLIAGVIFVLSRKRAGA